MEKGDMATSTTDADMSYAQPPPYSGYPAGTYPPSGPPPMYGAPGTPGYPGGPPQAYHQQAYPQQPGQYYGPPTTQGTVVQQQPGVVIIQQPIGGVSPPDYQALAWFACLCCCWPLGIVAIMKSNEVRGAVSRGDYNGANMASRSARTFSMISIGVGVGFLIMYLVLIVVWLIPLLALSRHY